MAFIGTSEKLEEIPFDELRPAYYIEAIYSEYLPVSDKFTNQYIYHVGTDKGCSCDFGIEKDQNLEISEAEIEQVVRNEKNLLDPIRKILGSYQKYIVSKIKSKKELIEQDKKYFSQTLKLIELITTKTTQNNTTELYCCWAGDYASAPEYNETVNLNTTDLSKFFNLDLNEKIEFVRR